MGFGEGSGEARGKKERIAVPAMPMPLAVICCILNFLVPGLGTMIAGFAACCCSRNEDMGCSWKCGSCMISLLVGLLQLLFTVLLFLGWIWSCIWGVSFIGMSKEYYHDNPVNQDGQAISQNAAGVSAVTVVTRQPGSVYPYGYGLFTAQSQPVGYPPQPPAYSSPIPPQPSAPPADDPPPPYTRY